ncbi:MAG: XRE family transcriptional regulator [Halarcobacter sp.]
MQIKPNMKSDFDEFLQDEGILAETEAIAIKRVIAYQIEQEMKKQEINKSKMAKLMHTSRTSVDRLLNPMNKSLTISTLEAATQALGKKLNISIS